MSRSSAPNGLKSRTKGFRLLIFAAVLVAIYAISLHPATGMLGGLFFLATSWVIPTAFNLLLAAWCALRLTAVTWLRCVGTVLFSFILGINTSFPALLSRFDYTPKTTTEIHRTVKITTASVVDLWMRDRLPVTADPLSSPIAVKADDGCGCMYFIQNPRASYFLDVNHIINQSTGRRGVFQTNYQKFPQTLSYGVHFDINFIPESNSANLVDLSINVYDGSTITASFLQSGIPYDSGIVRRIGRSGGLLNGYFLQNCIVMLLHDNFWTLLLAGKTSYVPQASLSVFLATAVRAG